MPWRKYSHSPGLSDGPAEKLDGKIGFLAILLSLFLIQSATFYFTCSSFSEMGRCLRRIFIRKCFILKCLRNDLKSLGNFRVWGFFFSHSV